MKTCSKCKRELELDQFNKRGDGKQPWCKDCNRERSRRYYAENRVRHLSVIAEQNRKRRAEISAFIETYKLERGCAICGYNNCSSALDAHHLRDKEFEVGQMRSHSVKRLKAELEKCVILCATHHRELHAGVVSLIG